MDRICDVYRSAFMDHGAPVAEALEPLERLACHCLLVDDSLPCIRRYLADLSPLARDLVLAHCRC